MVYEGMIKCPYCSHNGTDFEVQKEWYHVQHFVNSLICPKCQELFSLHYGEKKDGGKLFYTVPKSSPVK